MRALREWCDMLATLLLVALPLRCLDALPGRLGSWCRAYLDEAFVDPRKTWAGR